MEKRVDPILDDSINVTNYDFKNTVNHLIIQMPISVTSRSFLESGIEVLGENGILHYSDVVDGKVAFGVILNNVKTAAKDSGKIVTKLLPILKLL